MWAEWDNEEYVTWMYSTAFWRWERKKKDDKKEKYSDCMIVNQKFYTDINDIFKFSKEYDLPGNHVYHVYFDEDSNIMKQEEKIVYENPLQVKSRKRPDGEKSI